LANDTRKKEIDGLRGLAILLVLGFHYYVRWTSLYPYGGHYADIPVFKYGSLGVHLFFMISGYVIFMSLDACTGVAQFLWKRWTRLFPAMMFASALVFVTASLLPERPLGAPRPIDLIPGLIFVEAKWLQTAFGVDIRDLEGAFWSLYAEVRFYIIVGMLYFLAGRSRTIPALFALAIGSVLLVLAPDRWYDTHPYLAPLRSLFCEKLVGKHMPWFLIGMLSYLKAKGEVNGRTRLIAGVAVALALAALQQDASATIAGILIICVFLAVTWRGKLTAFFSSALFKFFGLISYPLYLIHENAGVALISKFGHISHINQFLNQFPPATLPLLALSIIMLPAFILAKYLEPSAQNMLKKWRLGIAAPVWPDPQGEASANDKLL